MDIRDKHKQVPIPNTAKERDHTKLIGTLNDVKPVSQLCAENMIKSFKPTKTSRQRKKFSLKELTDIGNFGTFNRKPNRNSSKGMTNTLCSPTNESVGFFSARTQAGTAEGTSRITNK